MKPAPPCLAVLAEYADRSAAREPLAAGHRSLNADSDRQALEVLP